MVVKVAPAPADDGTMEVATSESTGLFKRLTQRVQRGIPEPVVAIGLFRNPRLNSLPMDLALGLTATRVYVFALSPFGPRQLLDVWDRTGLHASAEEHVLSWTVDVRLDDGRRFRLAARRAGASRVNEEAVRLLTGG